MEHRLIPFSYRYLARFMINHDVVRLNVPVHYSHTVTIIQGLYERTKNDTLHNRKSCKTNENNPTIYTQIQ